jgi:hypothetical protein
MNSVAANSSVNTPVMHRTIVNARAAGDSGWTSMYPTVVKVIAVM